MKAAVVPLIVILALACSVGAHANTSYTIVPAGTAGLGIYLDKVGPEFVGSERLAVVDRLPRIGRQPVWAGYEIGEPITGGVRMYDEEGKLVRGSKIIVELYRLTFANPKTYYEQIYRDARVQWDSSTGRYAFSVPTDGLEADYYQLRLGLPNGNALDPEFRLKVGDAEYKLVDPPAGAKGCGCSG